MMDSVSSKCEVEPLLQSVREQFKIFHCLDESCMFYVFYDRQDIWIKDKLASLRKQVILFFVIGKGDVTSGAVGMICTSYFCLCPSIWDRNEIMMGIDI